MRLDPATSRSIDIARPLLLLVVVACHSLPAAYVAQMDWWAEESMWITMRFYQYSIPLFFGISGYLFFAGYRNTAAEIKRKWRSRFFSLLVPYILWCTVYGLVQLFKAAYLGYDDLGLFTPPNFIKGYWSTISGYPMSFVMWFIRNLIVYVALCPLIYFAARSVPLTAIALVVTVCHPDWAALGFQFFILGGCLSLHGISLDDTPRLGHLRYVGFPLFVIMFVVSYLLGVENFTLNGVVGFLFLLPTVNCIDRRFPRLSEFIGRRRSLFFFVFAFHGLFSGGMVRFVAGIVGCTTVFQMYGVSLLALVATFGLSAAVWWVGERTVPGLMRLFTGRR